MNRKALISTLSLLLVTILILVIFHYKKDSVDVEFKKPLFIAHASGGINGLTYLNSLEALNHNYLLGHRFFEVDFNWTADDKLVLIHDWKITYKRLFGINTEKAPTEEKFLSLKMNFKQTQLSLTQFSNWMETHPKAIVIADIKSGDNAKGLQQMLLAIKNPYQRIIPQIYHIKNYEKIKELGFAGHNIMYAMYRTMKLKDEIEFIKTHELFGISIQPQKPYFSKVVKEIGELKTPIYILTLNDLDKFNELKKKGVDGLVTDFLYLKASKILNQKPRI